MANLHIIEALAARLQEPLPGWAAQRNLIPEGRGTSLDFSGLFPAAVLIALYPEGDDWHFPLIKRTQDGFAHSGQIALPGGRRAGNESNIETALREAEEEVDLPRDEIQVLGEMTALPIPVSKHLVQPIIGFRDTIPVLTPEPREVDLIFPMSLNHLISFEQKTETRTIKGRSWEIPYFEVQEHRIWGATAMILSEFREILLQIDRL